MKKRSALLKPGILFFALLAFFTIPAIAQVPEMIAYQGRIAVGGINFNGSGQFKFALVRGNYAGNPGETFALWTNDGSGNVLSSALVPTASVSLTCDKGLYSVLLGNTALGMVAIPSEVFLNSDVRLRVWFNDGSNGFQLLSPDQRLVPGGYAMVADTALSVPDGSITAAKLAPGVIGTAQLAKPVQSGQLVNIPVTWDSAEFSATFPVIFSGTPAVTITPQSTDAAYAFATRAVVTSVSASGFSGALKVTETVEDNSFSTTRLGFRSHVLAGRAGYIYLESNNTVWVGFSAIPASSGPVGAAAINSAGNVGAPTASVYDFSLATVNGTPAYAAYIGGLGIRYSRSTNTIDGQLLAGWGGSISNLLNGSSYRFPELLDVAGAPMIFYIDNGFLRYIRATDANGTSWGAQQTIASDIVNGSLKSLAVAIILGNPAVAYRSTTGLRFVRASNSTGTSWPATSLIDSQSGSGAGASMAVVSNLPGISYLSGVGNTLKYLKSNDFVGSSWTSSTVDPAAGISETSVFDLGGAPAISYEKSGKVALVRATSSAATAWRTPVTITTAEDLVFPLSGDPFSFRNIANGDLILMRGRSVAPTISWMAQTP